MGSNVPWPRDRRFPDGGGFCCIFRFRLSSDDFGQRRTVSELWVGSESELDQLVLGFLAPLAADSDSPDGDDLGLSVESVPVYRVEHATIISMPTGIEPMRHVDVHVAARHSREETHS